MQALHLGYYGLLGILFFGASCKETAEQASAAADREAITAVSAARAKAFNKGDAAGIAVHFTEDAKLMAPGKPAAIGKEAVQHYYQLIFDEYNTRLESHYEEVEVSGNMAYGRGFARVVLFPKKGGDSLVSTAKYLNVLIKQADGIWKTTHDIWNGNEE
ncbi:MAG: SgcJ/EcaC family oxidoreductase [Chitinophagaceae bacterium]|nr:SgcJ/EcaC family oxidoreductase [Chitinophagaceae bacterium]